MLTPKISGLFDVRDYDGKTADHAARKMKADTDNITFSAMFLKNELPDQFKVNGQPDELLKERCTRRERSAAEAEGRQPVADALAVTFKIGANTKWFDKHGRACERPTNAELEESQWNVQIDFARREKDPSKPLKPSGYWVNAIMIAKIESNPFEGQEFEPIEEPETKAQEQEQESDNLPF